MVSRVGRRPAVARMGTNDLPRTYPSTPILPGLPTFQYYLRTYLINTIYNTTYVPTVPEHALSVTRRRVQTQGSPARISLVGDCVEIGRAEVPSETRTGDAQPDYV